MTGPGNELPEPAADRGSFRASRVDRDRAIEVLKTAFVDERLTKDAFDLRVDRALAARTYGDLAAVISDLGVRPADERLAAAGPSSTAGSSSTAGLPGTAGASSMATPSGTAGRTLARAVKRSGMCMLGALAMVGVAALTQGGDGGIFVAFLSIVVAVIAVTGLLGYGAVDAWREHRARGQLPPGASGCLG